MLNILIYAVKRALGSDQIQNHECDFSEMPELPELKAAQIFLKCEKCKTGGMVPTGVALPPLFKCVKCDTLSPVPDSYLGLTDRERDLLTGTNQKRKKDDNDGTIH